MSSIPQFIGPVVCTDDADRWARLLTDGFDLVAEAPETLDAAAMRALWGLDHPGAMSTRFVTRGTDYGIRVLALHPDAGDPIRDPASGYDADALKVVDFYTSDFDAAHRRLADAGFELKPDIARYEVEGVQITEGHLWTPDGAVFALLAGDPAFFSRFVSDTTSLFSEVMSVSAPVSDPAAVYAFYESLGLELVYRYEVEHESFDALVGAKQAMHVRSLNYGTALDRPYLGVIDYGLPRTAYRSLAYRARPPNRGWVAAEFRVPGIAAFEARHGATTLVAPHGVLHRFLPAD